MSDIASLTPQEFEQQVARIVTLLSESGAIVTWNARIPDPASPAQHRYIDVMVLREDHLTIVECRHRSRPQDVTWMEELYGRRESLRAGQVIAVSSSGFTEGAIRKAERLGIFVRELRDVTPEEAKDWGMRFEVVLEYVSLRDVAVFVVCADRLLLPSHYSLFELCTTQDGQPLPLNLELAAIAQRLPDAGLADGPTVVGFAPKGWFVGSTPVREVLTSLDWRSVTRSQVMPVLVRYGAPSASEAALESSNVSQTSVAFSDQTVDIVIDAAVNSFEPGSLIRGASVQFPRPLRPRSISVLGINPGFSERIWTQFSVIAAHSAKYRFLKRVTRRPGSSRRMPLNPKNDPDT